LGSVWFEVKLKYSEINSAKYLISNHLLHETKIVLPMQTDKREGGRGRRDVYRWRHKGDVGCDTEESVAKTFLAEAYRRACLKDPKEMTL
jgi:hypothetical protein